MKISAQDAWWQVILENDKVVLGKKIFYNAQYSVCQDNTAN